MENTLAGHGIAASSECSSIGNREAAVEGMQQCLETAAMCSVSQRVRDSTAMLYQTRHAVLR